MLAPISDLVTTSNRFPPRLGPFDRRFGTHHYSFVKRTFTVSAKVLFFLMIRRPPSYTLFPYTTLFRSSFWSVFTWGIWVAEAYSMIVPLAAVALPVPATLKPRAVSWLAVVEASPATLVPLRTWSCTWPGLTVGSDCDLAWAARRAVLRMWLSLAIARNKSSAGGWANSTRSFGLSGDGTTGAMMNCSAVVLSPLRLLAIAYMSVSVSPESVVSELAMSCTRPYSLVGADSELDWLTFCASDARKICWRLIRCRSEP